MPGAYYPVKLTCALERACGIIGAGSGFGSRLSIDILARASLADSTIALCDIHEGRLGQVSAYVQRAIDAHELPGTVVAGTDREELLPDADCVVTAVSIGGPAYWGEPYRSEVEIPLSYGVVQTVAASHEYASMIIAARLTGRPFAFNGNVMNHGSITNLPERCCVEVPCLADAEGVHPTFVGPLPAQCAALNMSNIAVQELAVQAVLDRDREAAFHACALDPLTAAVVPLPKVRQMFDELWAAEGDRLAYYG